MAKVVRGIKAKEKVGKGVVVANKATAAAKGARGVAQGGKEVERVASITYTEGMKRNFQQKLLHHGRDAVVKSRRTLEKRLQEHITKLESIRQEGGKTSLVEREI